MVKYVNSGFNEITGLDAEEYLGGDLFAWSKGAMPPQVSERILSEAEESGSVRYEFQLQHGDGNNYWCRSMTSVIRGDNREVTHYFSITEDISERKQVEAQLIQSSKLATLGQMAAGMAHELNQPLYIVRMAADRCLMEMDAGTLDRETELKHFQIVSEQCQRMADIIGHLRVFGRLGKTNCAMALQCTDPGARCCRHHGAQYSFRYFAAMFALKHVRSYRTVPGAKATNRLYFSRLGAVNHGRRNTGEIHIFTVHHAQRQAAGHFGIDGIATAL